VTYNERETLPWVIRREAPADNQALRAALYEGAVFHLPASATTRAVVSATNELLRATLGEEPRAAQFRLGRDALFQQVVIDAVEPEIDQQDGKCCRAGQNEPACCFMVDELPDAGCAVRISRH
jgi:hypothetical protein